MTPDILRRAVAELDFARETSEWFSELWSFDRFTDHFLRVTSVHNERVRYCNNYYFDFATSTYTELFALIKIAIHLHAHYTSKIY